MSYSELEASLVRENRELREQNRVLREALNTIACGTEDKIPPYRCIDFAMAKRIAQAALTATSQEGQHG